jgi:hypothetical protein
MERGPVGEPHNSGLTTLAVRDCGAVEVAVSGVPGGLTRERLCDPAAAEVEEAAAEADAALGRGSWMHWHTFALPVAAIAAESAGPIAPCPPCPPASLLFPWLASHARTLRASKWTWGPVVPGDA